MVEHKYNNFFSMNMHILLKTFISAQGYCFTTEKGEERCFEGAAHAAPTTARTSTVWSWCSLNEWKWNYTCLISQCYFNEDTFSAANAKDNEFPYRKLYV